MSYFDHLTKPLPLVTASIFSFYGNRKWRSISYRPNKDLRESLEKDVKNLFSNTFLRSKEEKKPLELPFYITDAIAIGIGTVAPLLISGFLKASPRKADGIHFLGSILSSAAMTAYFQYRKEYNDNNKKNESTV